MGAFDGYIGASVAVLMFGTNYIPVRRTEIHDGSHFQWMMANGILAVGTAAQLAYGGGVLTLGLVGGALWSISNYFVLPVVKLLGLGVGFSLYHVVNLVVGYAVGRYGLFGTPVSHLASPELSDASIGILVLSFAFMIAVEPSMEDGEPDSWEGEQRWPAVAPSSRGTDLAVEESSPYTRLGGLTTTGGARLPQTPTPAAIDMTRADSWQRAPEAVRDLARRNEDTETIQRERAASTDMASREMQLLYPEIGTASALAQPGGFRRAHLAERQAAVAGVRAVAYAETRLESKQPAALLHVSGMLKDAFSPATPGEHWVGPYSGAEAKREPWSPATTPRALQPTAQASAAKLAAATKPTGGKLLGVLLAIVAGALCGVNAVPFDLWNAQRGPDTRPMAFLFSQTLGTWATASVIYHLVGAWAICTGTSVPNAAIRPAYLSGMMWAVGESAQFVSLDALGMSQGYVFGAIGPVMLSSVISCVCFNEIRGRRNLLGFGLALALQVAGVVMLAVGSGGAGGEAEVGSGMEE